MPCVMIINIELLIDKGVGGYRSQISSSRTVLYKVPNNNRQSVVTFTKDRLIDYPVIM